LIKSNGLRNTSGPTYAPLEPAGSKTSASNTKTGNTKWQSVYPGIAISLTVEGQYPNLRRFVQELESSKQFVIINSVELERSTETTRSVATEEAPAGGTTAAAALVSLRLEMTTYFQRGSASEDTAGSAPAR
jgi:Tfp pilus assembly protein PilO